MRVEVIRAWPRRHALEVLELPEGSTVASALAGCGLPRDGISGCSVYGERVGPDAVLHDGDRLEMLPPLRIDPKDARRRRAGAAG